MALDRQCSNFSFVLDVSIIKGVDLVAKDKHWLSRKKTTSDPYVKAYYGNKYLGKTQTIDKTLNPIWNWKVRITVPADDASRARQGYTDMSHIRLHIFDKDIMSEDDFMGEVLVPVCGNDPLTEEWYDVLTGNYNMNNNLVCMNASGKIKIRLEMTQKKGITMEPGSIYEIPTKFDLTLRWNIDAGQITNLDNSCVAIDNEGNILMDQSVYSGQLINSNGSVRRSGLVENCETIFSCNLHKVDNWVRALYFILIVETPDKTFKDLKIISAKISDKTSEESLYQCTPKNSGEHTAMFLMRFVRENHTWSTALIDTKHHTARDFRTLTHEVRDSSRDIMTETQLQNT